MIKIAPLLLVLLLGTTVLMTIPGHSQDAKAQSTDLSQFFSCSEVPFADYPNGPGLSPGSHSLRGCTYYWGIDMAAEAENMVGLWGGGLTLQSGTFDVQTTNSFTAGIGMDNGTPASDPLVGMTCFGLGDAQPDCGSDAFTFTGTFQTFCAPVSPSPTSTVTGVEMTAGPFVLSGEGWMIQNSTGPVFLGLDGTTGINFYFSGGGAVGTTEDDTIQFNCPAGTATPWGKYNDPAPTMDDILVQSGLYMPGFQDEQIQITGSPGHWQLSFPGMTWPNGWSGSISTDYEGAGCGGYCSYIGCHPSSQLVGRTSDCTYYKVGGTPASSSSWNSPTGTVSWGGTLSTSSNSTVSTLTATSTVSTAASSTAAASTTLPFTHAMCSLEPIAPIVSACEVGVTSHVKGTAHINAKYSGDGADFPEQDDAKVKFVQGDSNVTLTCSPLLTGLVLQASCRVTVAGTPAGTPPSGEVAWNVTSGFGVLSSSTCTLANGICGETFAGLNASMPITILVTYTGDAIHPSKAASDTIVILENGTAFADQSQVTGLTVRVTGAGGAFANATSTYLLEPPQGTGSPPFSSAEYFDVRVGGVTGGTTTVCYFGAEVNATTSMDYYDGNWTPAANLSATAGVSVCGSIPTSALLGTPLAIGGGSSSTSSSETTSSLSSVSSSRASSSLSSQATSSTGGIPEFPFQGLASGAVVLLVIGSYLILRGRGSRRHP